MPSVDRGAEDIRGAFGPPRREAGFTLIEVLVVLAVVGLTLMMITWAMKPMRDRAVVMRTMAAFKTLSETARARALESGDIVALAIDIGDRTIKVPALDRTEHLSPDVAVSWVSASLSPSWSGQASILFLPDGTSTGGRLSARAGDIAAAMRISWVSGAAVDEP